MKHDLKWLAAYLGVMLILVPFMLLPMPLAIKFGRSLGKLLCIILPKWRRAGVETLTEMLPYLRSQPSWSGGALTPEEIVSEIFSNIGVFLAELSRLYFGKGNSLIADVEFRGFEYFEKARGRGRGVIGITAHCGNWELMALTFGVKVAPVAVVARNMKKGYFDRILEKIRLQHGNRLIYRDNGVKEMLLLLKNNGLLGILPDQVVKAPHGIPADFLGRPAWTTVMPAKLAIKTGCAILPFFSHREGDKNIITIYPELELLPEGSEDERILDGTVKMNRAIGEHILRHPAQWNWLYRRWKGNPEAAV